MMPGRGRLPSASEIWRQTTSASSSGIGPRASRAASGLSGTELHDQITDSFELVEVVDGTEVDVVERAEQFGLALKGGGEPVGVAAVVGSQHLDGDVAARGWCRARNTCPMPPAPSGVRISYGPSRVPGVSVMGVSGR